MFATVVGAGDGGRAVRATATTGAAVVVVKESKERGGGRCASGETGRWPLEIPSSTTSAETCGCMPARQTLAYISVARTPNAAFHQDLCAEHTTGQLSQFRTGQAHHAVLIFYFSANHPPIYGFVLWFPARSQPSISSDAINSPSVDPICKFLDLRPL